MGGGSVRIGVSDRDHKLCGRGAALVRRRPGSGPDVVGLWLRSGSELVLIWFRSGSDLVLIWF